MDTQLPQSLIRVLPRIRQALERPRNLIVLDARHDPPRALVAYFRAWLKDGLRLVALNDRDWRDVDSSVGEDTKLLIVLPRGRDLSDHLRDMIDRLDVRSYRVIGVDRETESIVRFVEPLPDYVDDRHAHAARTGLDMIGMDSISISPATLPMRLEISSHLADAYSAQFAIAGRGPDFPPGQIWFRMDPGFQGNILIDRDPGLRGDNWRLEIGEANAGPFATLNQTVPYTPDSETLPLDLLAIVLDRTCPDNANWNRAFDFVHGKTGEDAWRDDQGPENFNAGIRNGVTEGLKAAFDAGLVRQVQTWWFKDGPGDDMADFVDMGPSGPEVGQARPARTAEECRDLFSVGGYSPGLDLWDPVEQALEQAAAALEDSNLPHRAILIVGNSPPTDPAQTNSPLSALRIPPGSRMPCTTRRQSSGWHDTLDRCASRRIPVFYLFLRHTQFDGARPRIIEAYEHSQGRVASAIAKTVTLESVVADPDNVRDTTIRVIRSLRAQVGLASGVTLRNPRAFPR